MLFKRALRKLSIVFLSLGLTNGAYAILATNLLVDPVAMSLGNAVTAAPPGLSAMHFNPAGLAYIKGRQVQFNTMIVNLQFESEFSAGEDYEFFSYSDDPLVCDQVGDDGSCARFKTAKSKTKGISAIIPLRDSFLDLPPGPLIIPLLLPAFSIRAPDSKITYGTGLSAPLTAGYYRDNDDPGNYLGQRVAFFRVNYLTPSIGFKVTDEISVGATFNFAYQALGFESKLRAPNELTGTLRFLHSTICTPFDGESNIVSDIFLFGLCGTTDSVGPFSDLANVKLSLTDSLSPNMHFGIMWRPTRDFSWGAVFQTKADVQSSGVFKIQYSDSLRNSINAIGSSPTGAIALQILGIPTSIPEEEVGTVSQRFSFPAHFQTGIKYRWFDQVGLSVDLGWSNYSEWDNIDLIFDQRTAAFDTIELLSNRASGNSLSIPLGFQDVWNMGFGVEWYFNQRLTLRAGYEPRPSAIPANKRTPLIPLTNADLFGVGFGYKWSKFSEFNGTISYLASQDKIPANTSDASNSSALEDIVYNPYGGLNIKTEAQVLYLGASFKTRW